MNVFQKSGNNSFFDCENKNENESERERDGISAIFLASATKCAETSVTSWKI